MASADDEDGADVFGEVHTNNQANQAVISWVSLGPEFPERCSNVLNSHDSQIPSRLATEWYVLRLSVSNEYISVFSTISYWLSSALGKDWAQLRVCHLLYQKLPHHWQSVHASCRNQQAFSANPAAVQNGQIFDFSRFKNFSNVAIHWKSYMEHVHSNQVSKSVSCGLNYCPNYWMMFFFSFSYISIEQQQPSGTPYYLE